MPSLSFTVRSLAATPSKGSVHSGAPEDKFADLPLKDRITCSFVKLVTVALPPVFAV